MEEKLQAYRQSKRIQSETANKVENTKTIGSSIQDSVLFIWQKLRDLFVYSNDLFVKANEKAGVKSESKRANLKLPSKNIGKNHNIGDDNDDDDDDCVTESRHSFLFKLTLKVALWFVLFAIFIRLEFGLVYLVTSLLIVIYLNTRNKRRKNEISAYSVFNPNLERIDGTFTAEQMEKNLFKMF
jgi:hypothetical protein